MTDSHLNICSDKTKGFIKNTINYREEIEGEKTY